MRNEQDVIDYVCENARYTGYKYAVRYPATASRAIIADNPRKLVVKLCRKLKIKIGG
jgi:hypothetical protein